MPPRFSRSAMIFSILLVALVGLLTAGVASANPAIAQLLAVPDPAPALLLGAGLAGLAFQGRPEYHRR